MKTLAALLALVAPTVFAQIGPDPRPLTPIEIDIPPIHLPIWLRTTVPVVGGTMELTASGVSPGARVTFLWGSRVGSIARVLGSAVAGAEGTAVLPIAIPDTTPAGRPIAFRAVEGTRLSNVVAHETRSRGNVLVLLADDLGVDRIARYGVGAPGTLPSTPRIDGLADEGVLFRYAYSSPNCSPTRASIMTGRQPHDHTIGTALSFNGRFFLPWEETTIPEMLGERTAGAYDHSAVGKWHLENERSDPYVNPNLQGWNWYAGAIHGLSDEASVDGQAQTYFDWERCENGVVRRTTTYVTTSNADDAIARMAAMPEPWVLYVAFDAPHAPYHFPPDGLWSGVESGGTATSRKYNAMIEAMDTEIGRILDAMDADLESRTTVVFLADNGTPVQPIEDEFLAARSKATVYEGGIHVPFIVRSPLAGSPGATCDALVHAADLFATIAEIAGAPFSAPERADRGLDSISFAGSLLDPTAPGARTRVVSELFRNPGPAPHSEYLRAVRDGEWKLLQQMGLPDQFYDMRGVWLEGEDLLADGVLTAEEQAAYDRLLAFVPWTME